VTADRTVPPFELVVITGLSGSGMTEATKSFEDMGWLVMDNLPPTVIEQVAELCRASGLRGAAVVVRPSGREFFQEFFHELGVAFEALRAKGASPRILFLEASDEALVRRFEEKRRPHPLAPSEGVREGISRERELLQVLRDDAELVIDTSGTTPHELRERIMAAFHPDVGSGGVLQVAVASFGYKYGLPIDADYVFDTRFLPNPHWQPKLRPLTGIAPAVRDYVLEQEDAKAYIRRIEDLLEFVLPAAEREGKHYLTVAIGCTGGHHRSVVFAEELGRYIADLGYSVAIRHRDIERE
jgi:RNase adapter protein RapZ